MQWTNEHLAGLLPSFISEHDSADAVTQLDRNYAHGGGWHDFDGFELVNMDYGQYGLKYPGDPIFVEQARTQLRDETIVLFQGSWVAVIQPDGRFRVSRMD